MTGNMKRRIATIVFFVGMAFILQHFFLGSSRHHATVVIELPPGANIVDATVRRSSGPTEEPLVQYHRELGPVRFEVTAPDAEAELDIVIDGKATHRTLHFSDDGETITIRP